MNFVLYRARLPRAAVYTLVPVCLGVALVSYYDSQPTGDAAVKTTSPLGVVFAFSGVFASSLYTVWIGSYHRKLEMNSMQLLFNQAPWSAFVLLYVIPFVDKFPSVSHVSVNRWLMVLLVRPFLFPININPSLSLTGPWKSMSYRVLTLPHPVRPLRLPHQHLPILHHRTDGRRIQHRRRPLKDLYNRCPRLVRLRPPHRRQVHFRRHRRHRRYHNVRASLTLPRASFPVSSHLSRFFVLFDLDGAVCHATTKCNWSR